jgi:hypothetical protein
MEKNQIKSRDRVADFGEVYTNQKEVVSMINLVSNEAERLDSRFLEPACGSGNFLVEVLKRKLSKIETKHSKSQFDFERNSFLAISTIYGIDILEDNAEECRQNLLSIFKEKYLSLFYETHSRDFILNIVFLLKKNIIHGDALTLLRSDGTNLPIVFSEWSFIDQTKIKRRDFTLSELFANAPFEGNTLFSEKHEEIFIPLPFKDFPIVNYMEVRNFL